MRMLTAISMVLGMMVCVSATATETVDATGCHDVKGRVEAYNINPVEALGLIKLKIDREEKLKGGIITKILTMDTSSPQIVATLDQTLSMAGAGVIYTANNRVTFDLAPGSSCLFMTEEHINIVGGTGIFGGATGSAVAIGTVDFCSGEHILKVEGNYCVE